MIAITKEEKFKIQERFPDVCIIRTMKHDSKRHHYYMAEEFKPMRMLKELRGEAVPQYQPKRKKGRVNNTTDNKKTK